MPSALLFWNPNSILKTPGGGVSRYRLSFATTMQISRRTHADLREAYFLIFGEIGDGEWELRVGIDQVFWGVTESQHLVDVVNQIDLVEHPNGVSKLGQPMVNITWSSDWGDSGVFCFAVSPGAHVSRFIWPPASSARGGR